MVVFRNYSVSLEYKKDAGESNTLSDSNMFQKSIV